jgi:hypothetical protein
MNLQPTITRSVDGRELRVGERWPMRDMNLRVTVLSECVGLNPDRFIGRVELAGQSVLETAELPDKWQAEAQARQLLVSRIVELLAE